MTDEQLPIYDVLDDVLRALDRDHAVVLTAPPGAGKTTRVPPAILDSNLYKTGQIVVLEPRRMAARACAASIARDRKEPLGDTIGYQVRFETKQSSRTRILVVTQGILTRRFLADPFLEGVSCVVLDEFHERSIHSDLALAFLKELKDARPELGIVVMSATINASRVSKFLNDCPIIESKGRLHPLLIEHLPRADDRPIEKKVAAAVTTILRQDDDGGDILVFLPGVAEIHRTQKKLASINLPSNTLVTTLYGAMSSRAQDEVLRPSEQRRIVLATNIAETSLTIPGVTSVIDSGLEKVMEQDPKSGLDHLRLTQISRQSATQRSGRAGRTAPGRVIRLWTKAQHHALPLRNRPEIVRVDLCSAVLDILMFHPGNPSSFEFYEAPASIGLDRAVQTLRLLNALDKSTWTVSNFGKRLRTFPVHPRLAAILLRSSEQRRPATGASIAAILDSRAGLVEDQQVRSKGPDLARDLDTLRLLEQRGGDARAAKELGLSIGPALEILKIKRQLLSSIDPSDSNTISSDETTNEVGRLLLHGFADRVCIRSDDNISSGKMVGGYNVGFRGAAIEHTSAKVLIALEVKLSSRDGQRTAQVENAWPVQREDLEFELGNVIEVRTEVKFDPENKVVTTLEQSLLDDLILSSKPSDETRSEAISKELAHHAKRKPKQWIKLPETASSIRDRVEFARLVEQGQDWPALDEAGILNRVEELCYEKRSFAELEKIDWANTFRGWLGFTLSTRLDKHFPERLHVPSGSMVRIDYSDAQFPERPPVLAVKLQELFGLDQTPAIACGRIPLILHLLAPSGRPVQVTTDLANFWNNTYFEVRKELKGRYPKHPWPDEPRHAIPTRRAKPRKS